MEKVKILIQSTLFRNIEEEELYALLEKVHYQVKSYSTGDVVVYSGDECNELQIVLEGSVRGEMMDMAGRVLKIEDIGVSRPLAVAFLFGQNNRYPVTVTANDQVKLLVFPRESVLKMMQLNVSFLTNFMNDVSNRAQFISGKLKFLSFQSLKGKLAHYLLEQDQHGRGKLFFPRPRSNWLICLGWHVLRWVGLFGTCTMKALFLQRASILRSETGWPCKIIWENKVIGAAVASTSNVHYTVPGAGGGHG
jgi:CRP/FNR family transcriptional regulator, dissimilatory nitrate respiration regulator